MAAPDVETASVFSDTASDFSEMSKASTAATTATAASRAHGSHAFTCLSCHVAFRTADNQREHMRSDWHRYNLKRKVADIPPVSAENFAQRVQQQQTKTQEDNKPVFSGECLACRKTYSNENGYNNHLHSKKHKETQARYDDMRSKGLDPFAPVASTGRKAAPVVSSASKTRPAPTAEGSSSDPLPANWRQQLAEATTREEVMQIMERKAEATERLTELDCLFCAQKCQTFENNLAHMAHAHSFFIPDMEYLVDIKGLIKYLGEKIAVAHVCIYCNGKGRAMHTLEAVRKHMLDKGHCKILYEDGAELEVADFYDFSSTYPDEAAEGVSDGEAMEEGEGDEEWEDVDDEELGDMSSAPGAIQITEDETQLILPSGVRIGHRQYNKFWRQTLKPEDNRDSVVINQLMGQYRALGYQSTPYEVAVAHHERRMMAKKSLYAYQDFKARTGQKHNKLQKHFRSQIGFGV
ncbi:C2H2 type zinc-finger-domain-containing protein [Powellomyces hirtus]|nr:C2H2 type zinc-finger-domain-containing protein [Powellomyces hirtus]